MTYARSLVALSCVAVSYGASRLPEIGRGIGKGISNFKSATKDGAESTEKS